MKNILFLILVFQFLSCGSTTSTTTVDPHTQAHLSKHEAFMENNNRKLSTKNWQKNPGCIYRKNSLCRLQWHPVPPGIICRPDVPHRDDL